MPVKIHDMENLKCPETIKFANIQVSLIDPADPHKSILDENFCMRPCVDYEKKVLGWVDQALAQQCQLIVLPEYTTSAAIEIAVAERLKAYPYDVIVVCGSYRHNDYNDAPILIKLLGHVYTFYQSKLFLTEPEKNAGMKAGQDRLLFVNTGLGDFAIVICYDATDWNIFQHLLNRVDFVVVIAYNKATGTFRDHFVRACYEGYYPIIYSNEAKYGESSLFIPYKKRADRQIHIIPTGQEDSSIGEIALQKIDTARTGWELPLDTIDTASTMEEGICMANNPLAYPPAAVVQRGRRHQLEPPCHTDWQRKIKRDGGFGRASWRPRLHQCRCQRKIKRDRGFGRVGWRLRLRQYRYWPKKIKTGSDFCPGFAPLQKIMGMDIDEQVFSVGLVNQPLQLYKDGGIKTIELNRQTVPDVGLFTNQAKRKLSQACLKPEEMQQWARQVDEKMHRFFLGIEDSGVKVPLSEFPLRWASGGAFPVVTYPGQPQKWTPLFFRDIPPYGWQIPLGASERYVEWVLPRSMSWREFLEELFVVRPISDDEYEYRQPKIPFNQLDLSGFESISSALDASSFATEHREMRLRCDGMRLKPGKKLPIRVQETDTRLKICLEGDSVMEYGNILMAINPSELGIEVVVIVEYELNENDIVLDGEICEPHGKPKWLVRQPVALLSHKYLQKVFGKGKFETLNYNAPVQGSVEVPPPEKDEIIVFGFDIELRNAIIAGKAGLPDERKNYQQWYERFYRKGRNILAQRGVTASDDEPYHYLLDYFLNEKGNTLFTPTAAKIASYYFASRGL